MARKTPSSPSAALLQLARAKRRTLRRRLLAWYDAHGRDLPFRYTRDPYRIWLSEILLQQTRIETGVPYYERFLAAFPTVQALAAASEDHVLKLWEGLGYYNRARNLHRAAALIAREHAGRLPRSAVAWAALPGVGRYTAGAVASIALGEAVPAVDGNVKRVLARILRIHEDIDAAATTEALWALAGLLVPQQRPGDFNQALMELGAQVCLPRRPRCPTCPLQRQCEARAHGTETRLPVRRAKRSVPHRVVVAAAIVRTGRYLLGKRRPGGMLGGLWEFPGGTVGAGETHAQALQRIVRATTGLRVGMGELLGIVDHAYSHFTITLHLYACRVRSGTAHAEHYTQLKWLTRGQIRQHALPASDKKLLAALGDTS